MCPPPETAVPSAGSRGKLVVEHYGTGEDEAWDRPLGTVTFAPDVLHDLRSVSKSVVGLLYGIALGQQRRDHHAKHRHHDDEGPGIGERFSRLRAGWAASKHVGRAGDIGQDQRDE